VFYSSAQPGVDTVVGLYFAEGHYKVTEEHKVFINSLLGDKNFKVKLIRGFADTKGDTSYNLNLSSRRASAVYKYLLENNFADSTVTTEYYGERNLGKPYPYNERKVEIVLKRLANPAKDSVDSSVTVSRKELTEIYFVPDQAIIEPASYPSINEMAETLKEYRGCRFEVIGHVNFTIPEGVKKGAGTDEFIQKLSDDRAKAVYDIFIEKGIAAKDMKYRGAGNSQMIYKNPKNEEEKRKNMRVEILVFCNNK
jgi:outer membrane protein OmpA-like peptidoglycan-associated protein